MTLPLPRALGDGLVLRRSTPADTEALADFNARIHSDDGPDQPEESLAIWIRDLMRGTHPTFEPADFTIVEDTRTRKIVSTLNAFSQTWAYEGIPFGVGRPELIGTLPEYRRKGLVRLQMDAVHAWSAARGEIMQVITGIPWYYRQFGYEMALELSGGRLGYRPHVPRLKEGETEPVCLRPATLADIPVIQEAYAEIGKTHLFTCVRDEAMWRYEIEGRSPHNQVKVEVQIIETPAGEPLGYAGLSHQLGGPTLALQYYALRPGASWLETTPSVIRFLEKRGDALAAERGKEPWGAYYFELGTSHPVYTLFPNLMPRERKPYAWYVRIPDLPGFLQHIAPALENRLAASALTGYTGALALNFYRSGIRLTFTSGKITASEPWQPPATEEGDALFPDLTFLQLLCGRKSLEELADFLTDCYPRNDTARALLGILFPKKTSAVWGVA